MIAGKGRRRFAVCVALLIVACLAIISAASGINLPEASGKTVKKDGKMTIDCSNMSEGYIMVKGQKSKKRLKVQVATAGAKLNYDLNGDGEYEVFPLQFGNGKYQVVLFENASGKKYSKEGTVKLNAKMDNELSCFLYPNQYVNYNADSPCVVYAAELCSGMTDQADIYKAVCNYVTGNFVYDYYLDRGGEQRFLLYRFHVPDPIHFNEAFRMTLDNLGWTGPRYDDYTSVAYWYQTLPSAPLKPLPTDAEMCMK